MSTNGAADAHDRPNPLPLYCSVNGAAGDAEKVGELNGAVLAALQQGQVRFLPMAYPGVMAARLSILAGGDRVGESELSQ